MGSRIVILGIPGSGKTTLARKIGMRTGLQVIHLDAISHIAGWQEVPAEKLRHLLSDLIKKDGWIIEGETRLELETRLAAADTVIYMGLSRYICVLRTVKRLLLERRKVRTDVAPGCEDRLNGLFFVTLKWIWDFQRKHRTLAMEELDRLSQEKKVIRLMSARQLKQFERQLIE